MDELFSKLSSSNKKYEKINDKKDDNGFNEIAVNR